jgi:hypothetical protein
MSYNSPIQKKKARRLNVTSVLMLAMATGLLGCEQPLIPPPSDVVLAASVQNEQCPVHPVPYVAEPTFDSFDPMPQYAAVEPLTPEARADRAQLAEDVANPIANLASFPLRFTYQKSVGPKDAYTIGMLAQPLIPFTLSKDWNLVVQTNVPVNYVGSIADGVSSQFGLGDTLQGFYLVPSEPSRRGWIFGVGPAFQWPTATDDSLGTGKWGAGPTGALVRQYKGFTYGIVAHQLWSFAGDANRKDVNITLLHPLITYTWQTGTSLTLESDSSYSWVAKQWSVPLQLSIAQVVIRGKRPLQLALGGRYYVEGPPGGPEWGIRFSVIYLFPK